MKKTIHIRSDKQRETLKALEIPDGHVVMIREEKNIRRLEANSYYWGALIDPMADHYGYRKDEMHQEMKKKYLYPILLATDEDFVDTVEAVRDVYKQGLKSQALYMMEFIYSRISTTNLSIKQFYEYSEAVKEQALMEKIKLMTREEWEAKHD